MSIAGLNPIVGDILIGRLSSRQTETPEVSIDRTHHDPATARREGESAGAGANDDRLARSRRAAWAGTAVIGVLAVVFFSLFAAFGRPLIGLAVDGTFLVPTLLIVWIDHAVSVHRARRSSARDGPSTRSRR